MLSGYSGFVNGGSEVQGSISSKAAATYNTSTSDQTIASGQYLSGAQTIKAVTTSNISAANIRKGVNIKVGDANSAGRIANVTGTWYGDKKTIAATAYDFKDGSTQASEEQSFTMPTNGTVYYGGASVSYYKADVTCRIYKNGTLIDNRDISGGYYDIRNTMFNKSFSASTGDVIKVSCTASRGTSPNNYMGAASIQAVIVY
jgi:hypothetical protein